MKKAILIYLLLTGFNTVQAQHFFKSEFSLTMFNHSFFAIRFDNELYPNPNRKFFLDNIKPGQHYVEVIKYRKKNFGQGTIPVVISQRWVTIPSNSKVIAFVDDNHQIRITDVASNCYVNNLNHNPNPYPGCQFMSENEFRQLKNSMMSASFESSRMTIARQAVSNNRLLSRQVQELMQQFWFESSRLELAKFAYDFTYDQENYYIVNNAFQFDSSIRELDNYINHS